MMRDTFSGIGSSFEDAIGSLLISLLVAIWGMVVTVLVNVAVQLNVPEAASWTLEMWSLFLLMISTVDAFGVFGLGMIGLFASIFYVVGRIIGYAFMYWLFSLIQEILPILQIQIPTTPILLNILLLFMLLAARVAMGEGQTAVRW
ncbi:hypothetical protein [Archaeoglobus sp.]